jgi:hypothetical protein
MIDRETREPRECGDRLLILVGELFAIRLLGQVQAPERRPTDNNRNPEERVHRRMPQRKPVGPRMLTHLCKTQRHRIADRLAQHPPTPRQHTDLRADPLIDPHRDEPRQLRPRGMQRTESRVPGTGQRTRRVKHPVDHHIEVQLAEHAGNLKQTASPLIHQAPPE